MNIRKIKFFIDEIYGKWYIERMDDKDQNLIREMTSRFIDRSDNEELSTKELLEIIRQIISTASKNLIKLIRETLDCSLTFNHYADLFLALYENNLLDQTNLEHLLTFDSDSRKFLKTLFIILDSDKKRLTQPILDLFYAFCPDDPVVSSRQKDQIKQLTHVDKLTHYDEQIDRLEILHLLYCNRIIDYIDLSRIFFMRDRDLFMLEYALGGLARHNLLNLENFNRVMRTIESRLPKARESQALKSSRKLTGRSKSKLTVTGPSGDTMRLYLQHDGKKRYPGGRYGRIKMGFEHRHKSDPAFAIKVYRMILELSPEASILLRMKDRTPDEESRLSAFMIRAKAEALQHAGHEARREAKYHELLGSQPRYFMRNNKYYLVTTWRPGKDLYKLSERELSSVSIDTRLQCLASAFTDLSVFHKHNSIHGDIKPDNFIVDLNNGKMRLTDFGLSHSASTNKIHPVAASFCDGYTFTSSYCDDIYSMGYVVAQMFPEIFSVLQNRIVTPKAGADNTLVGQALIALQSRLMSKDREGRCTADDAMRFTQALIDNSSGMNSDSLKSLITGTIARRQIVVDDVLQGRLHPSL